VSFALERRKKLRQSSFTIGVLCLSAVFWPGYAPRASAQVTNLPTDDDLARAKQLAREAHWQDAERLLRGYLADHAASVEAQYLLAFTLFREDKPKDSLAEYTHAAQLQTPTALELRWVALDYVLLQDYTDADKWITRSLQLDEHDSEAWYEMGRIKYQENRFAEAITAFQKTLAMVPKLVKAENNLGLAYEGLNQKDDAVRAYRQAIEWQAETGNKSEQPLLNLGILFNDEGQVADALPLLLEAEAIAPDDEKTHATLGKLYLRQGNLKGAEEEFEKAVAIDPKSASVHFQLGQVYRKQGKTSQASAEFAKASEIDGSTSSKNQ
jgi:tetratricopeptide (TPR) repeat protein